jgi:hypothetical protein
MPEPETSRRESGDVGPCPACGAPQRFADGAPAEEARFWCHECFRDLVYVPGRGLVDTGHTAQASEIAAMAETLQQLADLRRDQDQFGTVSALSRCPVCGCPEYATGDHSRCGEGSYRCDHCGCCGSSFLAP